MEQTLLSPVAGLSPNNGELSAVRGGGGGWGGGAPRDPHEVIHFEPRSSCRERHLKLPFDFLLMIKNIDFTGEAQSLITQLSLWPTNRNK